MIRLLKPYSKYKDSGLEWVGEVPEHWEVQRIKHFLSVNESTLREDTYPDFTFNYLEIGSVGTGHLLDAPRRIQFQDSPSRARRVVREGDTLFSTVRTYLKAVWHADAIQSNLVASTGFAVLTPGQTSHPKFVNYYCQSEPFTDWVSANSVGVAYPAIPETDFAAVHSVVPSYPEQEAIARFLDHTTQQVDQLVEANQKLVKLLNELNHATIQEAVTGRIDVRTGKPYAKYKDSGVEWLSEVPGHWKVHRFKQLLEEKDIRSQQGDEQLLQVSQYTGITKRRTRNGVNETDSRAESLLGYKCVEPDDLVVNIMLAWNGSIGVSMYSGIVSPAYCVYRFRLDALPRYFHYLLRSATYKTKIKSVSTGIVESRLRLYTDDLYGIESCMPPLDEQKAIVHFLDHASDQIEKAIDARTKKIGLLKEYRTRLIADVVTGKVDVRAAAADLPGLALEQMNKSSRCESN